MLENVFKSLLFISPILLTNHLVFIELHLFDQKFNFIVQLNSLFDLLCQNINLLNLIIPNYPIQSIPKVQSCFKNFRYLYFNL